MAGQVPEVEECYKWSFVNKERKSVQSYLYTYIWGYDLKIGTVAGDYGRELGIKRKVARQMGHQGHDLFFVGFNRKLIDSFR